MIICFSFLSYRIKQRGCPGGWNHTAVGFSKILRPTGATERNLGSVTSHTVRSDRFLLTSVSACFSWKLEAAAFFLALFCLNFSSFSRLVNKDFMSSRSHSCPGPSAAVLRFRGSVLQLRCSVQHRCCPGAPPEAAQHWRPFSVKVSSDPHVFLCAKSKCEP